MTKNLYLVWCLLLVAAFSSCSDNNEEVATPDPITVQLTCKDGNVDFSTFQVTLTELRSTTQFTAQANAEGDAIFRVPLGQYDVVAENGHEGGASTYYGSKNNVTLSESNRTIQLEVQSIMDVLEKTFVLDELFFNCSKNGEYDNNWYEEYVTLTNVSNRPLYADGISIAICGDYNAVENEGDKSVYLPDSIVVSQVYTIPGNGTQHLVQPGQSLVIAHSAIDHSEGGKKPKARDLRGADFEIYVPHEYAMTTDNPEVTNMVVDYSMFQAFQWGYTGNAPMMLLKADTDLQSYVPQHLKNMDIPGGMGAMKQNYLIIPTRWVIDGVETGATDYFFHKVLPDKIDRGRILVNEDQMGFGGFNSLFVKRKAAAEGYLQDTNNSTDDFEVIPDGQKNYPL